MFLFPKKHTITLDIGFKFIKAARFQVTDKHPILVQFEMVPTPKGSVSRGEVVDNDVLQHALENLLIQKMQYNSKNKVNMGISGKSIITRKIDIPQSEEKLIKDHVHWEANQYLPCDIEEVNYDYQILPFTFEQGMTSIFFVSSNKKTIHDYIHCLSNLSIGVDVMDTMFFALQRVFSKVQQNASQSNVLLLDIGAQKTDFTIVKNGQNVIFTRELFIGSDAFVEEIQMTLGVTKEEAEDLFISACNGSSVPSDVTRVIEARMPHFCSEILVGQEYFNNHFHNEVIAESYMTGGSIYTPQLQESLTKQLELPVSPLPVLRGFQTKGFSKERLESIQPFIGGCLGLILS